MDPATIFNVLGLFLFLVGFVVGMGAVTVIDVHGLLGRKSRYWTETTIRAHKVTKPLIWIGVSFAVIGGFIFYRDASLAGIPLIHGIIAAVLLLNGAFLSFYVSPVLLRREREGKARELLPASLKRKIILSLVVSDICWWLALFLLVWYLAG